MTREASPTERKPIALDDARATFPNRGRFQRFLEDQNPAELYELHFAPKWIDLCWLRADGLLEYLATRPA